MLILLDLLLVLVGLIAVVALSKELTHCSIGSLLLLLLLLELLVVVTSMLSSVSISIVRVEVIV